MMTFETQEDLAAECFRLNWIGGDLACHMEPRNGSVVLVRRDRVIGQVAQ